MMTSSGIKNLNKRFIIAAIFAVIVSLCVTTAASYYYLRVTSLEGQAQSITSQLGIANVDATNIGDILSPAQISRWQGIQRQYQVTDMAYLDSRGNVLWESKPGLELKPKEANVFRGLLSNQSEGTCVVDPLFSSWQDIKVLLRPQPKYQSTVALSPVRSADNSLVGVIKSSHDFSQILAEVKNNTIRLFLVFLLGHSLLVLVLYLNFRRGTVTIGKQEDELSQQVKRLSNLLNLNKALQASMKTASSRAVELNEKFLRRVGSDLHDGPAQALGYAALRIDQIQKKGAGTELAQEFHAIKEALDTSLIEIRGISTGLVLPELEELTLEQALNRVVEKHSMNSETIVMEYYTNLPSDIPLPIKISAYRFVQEGLNNASRHGLAKKCRVSAQVKGDMLLLSLKDNGMGFRKSQLNNDGGHLGLKGLQDRIESLGGKFAINSELGVGTAIKISIALTDEAQALIAAQKASN